MLASASCVDRFKPGLAMFGALGLMNVVGAQAQPADLPIAVLAVRKNAARTCRRFPLSATIEPSAAIFL